MPENPYDGFKKRILLRRVRRQRLKYITILPSLITLMNGICGFVAIIFASRGQDQFAFHKLNLSNFAVAGYLIFFAMIADMLDGRVARMSHTTSSFGGQLDSLCDMISFGVAPAFLMLMLLENQFIEHVKTNFLLADYIVRFIWLSGGVFLICAAIRLARFNVENEEDETAHMSFVGLPTPAAGGVMASLVVFFEGMIRPFTKNSAFFDFAEKSMMCILPFVAIGTGILMISRVRYPHLVNQYFKGRKPVTHLTWSIVIFAMIWICELPSALVIAFCGFALSGVVRLLYLHFVIRPKLSTSQNHDTNTTDMNIQ